MARNLTTALAAAALLVAGCGRHDLVELEGLELMQAEEVLSEFSLGKYMIPIPFAEEQKDRDIVRRHRLQLDFTLYALVAPAETAQMADAWARHEGKIRDHVIRVCRNASLDELQEPDLNTLKGRLIDALAGPLGNKHVQQLLISEIVTHQM